MLQYSCVQDNHLIGHKYERTRDVKNYVYIAQSMDGYIAGPSGELDWLDDIENPENNDLGFSEFMESVDALIMGRNTFEKVISFGMWPYQKPVFVASKTVFSIPSQVAGKAFVIAGDPHDMVSELNEKGYRNIYVDGGAVIQSFLRENLIDEIIVTTVPILLGKGISLFGELSQRINLRLINSRVELGQLVKSHYAVNRA